MPKLITVRIKSATKGDVTFQFLKKQYSDLSTKHVTIGILQPERHYPDSDATLGEVAMWQEFGTQPSGGRPGIPARSFLRTPFDVGINQIFALKTKLLGKIADRTMTVARGLAILGADGVRRIQSTIKRRINPPLRPYTLERRKQQGITGTVPLLATRFLYNSIHFAVRTNQDKD